MSKIMRQLEAEARASRQKQERHEWDSAEHCDAGGPREWTVTTATPSREVHPGYAVCAHAISMTEPCYACSRIGAPRQLELPLEDPYGTITAEDVRRARQQLIDNGCLPNADGMHYYVNDYGRYCDCGKPRPRP